MNKKASIALGVLVVVVFSAVLFAVIGSQASAHGDDTETDSIDDAPETVVEETVPQGPVCGGGSACTNGGDCGCGGSCGVSSCGCGR
ncbi:MAG: hypothetical protein ACQESE_04160 [Nanobdellota archaeon]